MDPNATLQTILSLYDSDEWDQLYDACEALAHWLMRGGFAPACSVAQLGTTRFGKPRRIVTRGLMTAHEYALQTTDDGNAVELVVYFHGKRKRGWTLPTA